MASEEQVELIRALGTRFVERRDVKAVQGEGIPWQPVRQPFVLQDFVDHLDGRRTFGHYMVGANDDCKLFAYDIDLNAKGFYPDPHDGKPVECNPRLVFNTPDHPGREWFIIQLRGLAEGLAIRINRLLNIPVAIATTGSKGLHVYGFTGPRPADICRQLGIEILDGFGCFEAFRGECFFRHREQNPLGYGNLSIEVFPKQGSIQGKDLGNLMKLPLGVHRETGQRSTFITTKVGMNVLAPMDPLAALTGTLPWE